MWEDVRMTSAPRPPGPRALARERTMARIVEPGNAPLGEQGVAGLSVRETARGTAVERPRARFLALGDAMCAWAISHPERWALLYGTPVRDYSAPAETTNADGTRVIRAVLCIAADAAELGSGPAAATGAEPAPQV